MPLSYLLITKGFTNQIWFSSRTTKALVKDELKIPTQTRYLVPINLGRVERHVRTNTLPNRHFAEVSFRCMTRPSKRLFSILALMLEELQRLKAGISTVPC